MLKSNREVDQQSHLPSDVFPVHHAMSEDLGAGFAICAYSPKMLHAVDHGDAGKVSVLLFVFMQIP